MTDRKARSGRGPSVQSTNGCGAEAGRRVSQQVVALFTRGSVPGSPLK